MRATGLGVVFAGGAGVAAFEAALAAGRPLRGAPGAREAMPVLAVPAAALSGGAAPALLRRADRFSKMAFLAAAEALAGLEPDRRARTGVILTTAFGPHVTVFRFLNEILEFGDRKTSPTVFSQSVHVAAGALIATALELRGPTLTLADLAGPFVAGLHTAAAWLAADRCDAVLVGAVDELSDVLAHVARRKWGAAADGIARPFPADGRPAYVPGEGAVFVRLEKGDGPGAVRVDEDGGPGPVALEILDACALGGDDRELAGLAKAGVPAAAYSALTGSTRMGVAFAAAAGLVMRRAGRLYAGPLALPAAAFPAAAATGAWPGGAFRVLTGCAGRGARITFEA